MNFELDQDGARAIITLEGDLLAPQVQEMRPVLKKLLEEGVLEFVFDMTHVALVDSLGIGLMIMCHNSLKKAGGRFTIINPSPELLDELRPMRLDRHFNITAKD